MNVCVIGAGYVGLTTSSVLADLGHHVYCVDKIQEKVDMLNNGEIPIYEAGLDELVINNRKNSRLFFSTDLKKAVKESTVIFIAVGTPPSEDGSPNLVFLESVVDELVPLIDSYKIIVTKSTVPLGTNEKIHQKLVDKGVSLDKFDVVSNPEFLREGTAIKDMLFPDKIVVGSKRPEPIETIKKLYASIKAPYVITNLNGAEMIKYASNAFLAVKLSFINELALISDVYGVDITEVAKGLGLDPRIGSHFLQAGLGYGGSCLPKDIAALEYQAVLKAITPHLLQAAKWINDSQIDNYLNKLESEVPDFRQKKITVWGASFKPNTDDTRESQALKLIDRLVHEGCKLNVYDPVVKSKIDNVNSSKSMYESIQDADVLIIATEWQQFIEADWSLVKNKMNDNYILDCRNCLSPSLIHSYEFQYVGIARQ